MRIEDALSRVRTIQTQVARTEQGCCYRSATVAASGLMATVAAIVQLVYLPRPLLDLRQYLVLWVTVAAVSVAVIAAEILVPWKWHGTHSRHARRQTLVALKEFAPCVVAGALVTWAIAAASPEHAALLPGLWATIFSLGVFASATHLPPGGRAVAAFYLGGGSSASSGERESRH